MEPLEMDPNEKREMVLATSASLGRKVVEACEVGGLTEGFAEDELKVGQVTWHLQAQFFTASGFLRLTGKPHIEEDATSEEGGESKMTHAVLTALGFRLFADIPSNKGDDGSFSINLPKGWLPRLAEDASALVAEAASTQ